MGRDIGGGDAEPRIGGCDARFCGLDQLRGSGLFGSQSRKIALSLFSDLREPSSLFLGSRLIGSRLP
jgi:hypothetical protein